MTFFRKNTEGFTLVELLVSMAILGLAMTAIFNVFVSYNRAYVREDATQNTVQDARGALELMAREIRMCGFRGLYLMNPYTSPVVGTDFGLKDTGRDNVGGLEPGWESNSGRIRFTMDLDEDGAVESYGYGRYDSPVATPDGIPDLYRFYDDNTKDATPGKREMLIERVDGLEFAYAIDPAHPDPVQDLSPARDGNGNVIWVMDTNGDGTFDIDIDTNDDGEITDADAPGGEPLPGATSYKATDGIVRAVRIWLLVRVDRLEPNLVNSQTYVVGNKRYKFDDQYRRVLVSRTVRLWNEGLRDD